MKKTQVLIGRTIAQQPEKFTNMMQLMKLDKAANLLGCGTDELLHLGATGRVEIIAPVVAAGEFSWPPDIMASGLIELDEPIVEYFDASSRIILFPRDLARIEAVGWTIPWQFYSPRHAQEVISQANRSFDESLIARHEKRERNILIAAERFPELNKFLESKSDSKSSLEFMPGSLEYDRAGIECLRKTAINSPWTKVEPFDESHVRTTVEHLFISRDELIRLRDDTPQTKNLPQPDLNPPNPEHGNVVHNYRKRYQILLAAIWVYRKEIKALTKATVWAEKIEVEAAYSFWPKMNVPPYGNRKIEEILRLALRDDCGSLMSTESERPEHSKN